MAELIGWMSAVALMVTLGFQIVGQWKDRTNRGVSKWLFIGQLASSIGFIIYSALLNNIIFVVTNSVLALIALIGEYTYVRNRRMKSSPTAELPHNSN